MNSLKLEVIDGTEAESTLLVPNEVQQAESVNKDVESGELLKSADEVKKLVQTGELLAESLLNQNNEFIEVN